MAASAVATPLTGENLVPQGVRDATTTSTPQQIEQYLTQANTTPDSGRIRELLRSGFTRMEQLAELAELILQQLYNHPKDPMNGLIAKGFIQQVKIYASSQGECTQAITEFKELLGKVQQDVTAIRTTTEHTSKSVTTGLSSDSANVWRAHQAQAWQATIQSAASPQSQSRSVGSSSPGVSHAELGMDCEIVVKIRDDSDRRFVKKLKLVDIVTKAERARAHAAKSTPSLPLAGHAFTAARHLPSGDISLRANTAAGAEVLRKHCNSWVHVFGKSAYVRVPTWGIVIDGMPAKFVDMSEEFKRELIADNTGWGQGGFEVEIAHVGWLVKPKSYSGSLIVEFTNPVVANNALNNGTIWHSHSLTNRPYCKEGRVKMCKKCQKYGHVQAQCPDPKFYCGLCAEEHPTWECPSKRSRDLTPKCVNCSGSHKTSSDNCPVRQKETARARHAVLVNQNIREHRVPQYLQARVKQQNTNPTPGEAANMTAARKQQQPQPQKKVLKKAAITAKNAKNKKAQHATKDTSKSAPAPAPEQTSEQVPKPVHAPERVYEPEPELELELEHENIAPTIEQPALPEAPTAPRTASRTMVQGPSKAIPFGPTGKRPRGRPPKSKTSTNDEGEPTPHEHISTALAATQPNLPTIDPALLSNHNPVVSTAPTAPTGRKATRSQGLDHNVDMRQDPEEPLREQRRRERSRSQSYDNTPLPPLPPMNMHVDDDNNIVLESAMSFQEIDSGGINSDIRQDLLAQFTNHNSNRNRRWRPNNGPIREESGTRPLEEHFEDSTGGTATTSSSSPDLIEKW